MVIRDILRTNTNLKKFKGETLIVLGHNLLILKSDSFKVV